MAKIKLGAIVTEIRGKLAGHVFSKNRGGAYMRTKGSPTNPQTASQTSVRALFALISGLWSSLTDNQRGSWRGKVALYARTDVFGDLKNPSGKALHQRLNQNLGNTGQDLITVCPDPSPVQSLGELTGTASIAGGTIDIAYVGNVDASKIIVFATAPQTNGTKFVKNKLRQIEVFDGGEDESVEVSESYESKFGSVVVGDNLFFGLRTVNANGQASPLQIIKTVVVA